MRGSECVGGHHRCEVLVAVFGGGPGGGTGISRVPVVEPSLQTPGKGHRFSQGLPSRCQSDLVTAGRRVSTPPQQHGCPRSACSRQVGRMWGWPAWPSVPLVILLLGPQPAHGLWCQDCTLTTNSSHCTPKQCQPSDTVCASVRITDPSSSRKDHSVNRMCASSCDFVKRHFFSDYLMGFINSGILKVDVDCCEKDLCNGVSGARGSPWALAGGLLLSLGPTLLRAGP
ncbi:lymphocyte antigen 6 family member H [Rhinolophus ferrumequinum]|uniref:Lymphocyte antigen 6H n=1 Tax=Rhinolophus ferrumequinum TaxID=59479 RepID=A0A7J7VE96_RHIFE|nr:lymphocyte antigen 6 family member H [Rhinolophus ferrumequinum]